MQIMQIMQIIQNRHWITIVNTNMRGYRCKISNYGRKNNKKPWRRMYTPHLKDMLSHYLIARLQDYATHITWEWTSLVSAGVRILRNTRIHLECNESRKHLYHFVNRMQLSRPINESESASKKCLRRMIKNRGNSKRPVGCIERGKYGKCSKCDGVLFI